MSQSVPEPRVRVDVVVDDSYTVRVVPEQTTESFYKANTPKEENSNLNLEKSDKKSAEKVEKSEENETQKIDKTAILVDDILEAINNMGETHDSEFGHRLTAQEVLKKAKINLPKKLSEPLPEEKKPLSKRTPRVVGTDEKTETTLMKTEDVLVIKICS